MLLVATLLNQTKLSTLPQSLGLKIVKLWLLKYFLPLWDRKGDQLHQILNCRHFPAKPDKTKTLGDITADSQSSSSCCIRTGPAPRPCGQWSPPQLGKCPQQMCCWYISPSSTTPSPPSAQVCVLSRTNIPWEERRAHKEKSAEMCTECVLPSAWSTLIQQRRVQVFFKASNQYLGYGDPRILFECYFNTTS